MVGQMGEEEFWLTLLKGVIAVDNLIDLFNS